MLQGALHIHSTYSDGEFTLRELRSRFAAAGCSFLCMTDHASAFNRARLEAYQRELAELSDDSFVFVPGLEYDCVERTHMLGYGMSSLVEASDPVAVIDHIERHEGIAVVAHPRAAAFAAIEGLATLPRGIEVWNSKYDGRFAPRGGTFALLARVKARRPEMTAFYGQDLHWRRQYRGLLTLVDATALTRDAILDALRSGRYFGLKEELKLRSSGEIAEELLERFDRIHARSEMMRRWMRRAKRCADAVGIPVPRSMKAELRRIF